MECFGIKRNWLNPTITTVIIFGRTRATAPFMIAS